MTTKRQLDDHANLLSSAPLLLAAAKAVIDRSGGNIYHTDQETGETFDSLLRSAILKAEGGAS